MIHQEILRDKFQKKKKHQMNPFSKKEVAVLTMIRIVVI